MSESVKVLLYTVVASALPWFAIERFLGTTGEYASRLNIGNTPQDPNRDPVNEVINPVSAVNAPSVVWAETDPDASVGSIAIRGASPNRVDFVVEAFRRCDTAVLVTERNPEGRVDDDERLVTRRDEELKYSLLQRRVPRDAMRFSEDP